MSITVNLLPQDLIGRGAFNKFLRALRSFSVIGLAIFLILILGASVLIFTQNRKVSELSQVNENIKKDIAALEVSEQQLVLLKDRIKKIQTIHSLPNSLKNLAGVESLIATLPETAAVTDLEIDSKKIDLSINFKSNVDMSNFITNLGSSTAFKSIILSSFGLSATSGYLVSLSIAGL